MTAESELTQCVSLVTLTDHAVEDIEIIKVALVNNSGIGVGSPLHLSILPAEDGESNAGLCISDNKTFMDTQRRIALVVLCEKPGT